MKRRGERREKVIDSYGRSTTNLSMVSRDEAEEEEKISQNKD